MYKLISQRGVKYDYIQYVTFILITLLCCTSTSTAATLPTKYLRILDNGMHHP